MSDRRVALIGEQEGAPGEGSPSNAPADRSAPPAPVRRLGVVSYLNAKPLIAGLDADPAIDLHYDVPARLPAMLEANLVDVALVPVIDLAAPQRAWRVLSDACIGCDGETYTVRVFSRVPPADIRTLHVDGDSHTSVALASIIWRERYGRRLNIAPLNRAAAGDSPEAVLLIGDKVVNHTLLDYELETDLGSAWKSLTSLPFVFAVWAAQEGTDWGDLPQRLSAARDRGVAAAAMIAADFGPGMGWPVALATRYLTARLKFHLGDRQREGMGRFLALAKKHGLTSLDREPAFA